MLLPKKPGKGKGKPGTEGSGKKPLVGGFKGKRMRVPQKNQKRSNEGI